jgi:predicted Co/Zn/Cd cation transporter (cation efflux family)
MAAPDPSMERRPLLRSIALTGCIGALGVAWGLVTGSQMIMLDGAYSLIGLVVSWLLLLASALAGSEPGGRFPFGKESVTPLVIGVQGFVLLATLAYAAVQSVSAILEGGSEVTAGPAIVYSTITSLASVGFWWWLRSVSGDSDLLAAETTGWRVGAFRGLAMVVGFVTMGLLARSSWWEAAPYVDPVMVLLTCVLFLHTPIIMVRTTIIELLEGEPHVDIRSSVLASVDQVRSQYGFGHAEVRMTKLGPKLYVEVEILVEPDVTVAVQHDIREDLRARLDTLPFDLWLNVELLPRRVAAS